MRLMLRLNVSRIIYVMTLDCNGLEFDVCINAEDLMGEPEIGRRLKASIWLQGKIDFEENEIL